MMWALIALAILIGLMIYAKIKTAPASTEKANPFDGNTELPYTRRPPMTETELQVYDILLEALPHYMVFPQVQVSRVIESPQENNLYWFNFINRLSYDFVICRADGTAIVAIEIDDDTHELASRKEADIRKNLATESAGITMLRWDVRHIPSARTIAQLIQRIDRQSD